MPGHGTDTAHIILWIEKNLPEESKLSELIDNIFSLIQEIILNNLSQGRQPISFESVREIADAFREIIYRSIEQSIGVLNEEVKEQVDAYFFRKLSDIYDKYYS
jgi:hypothetical protein